MLIYNLRTFTQLFCRVSRTNSYPSVNNKLLDLTPINIRIFPNNKHTRAVKSEEQEDDTPIKYTSSRAANFKASTSRHGAVEEDRLWYEPYVLLASLAVFLIYFTIIREENDVDKELGRSLYSRVDGLEEVQLRASLRYNIENGKDTQDIEKRLKEIEQEKLEKAKAESDIVFE